MPFPVEGRWITATEQKLGVRFATPFNTGRSSRKCRSTTAATSPLRTTSSRSTRSLCIKNIRASDRTRIKRTTSSIDRETASARAGIYKFPQQAVVIGSNGGGDLLVLLSMDDDPTTLQHTVYRYDHETGELERAAHDFNDLSKS